MIKPLKRFITATPLGALMSLTLQHPLQYPSLGTSDADAPFVLVLCSVCFWSWVNKWVFLAWALQIDLLAQTICSCSALAKWLCHHWSIDTACHLRFTWFFLFFVSRAFSAARLLDWSRKSSQWSTWASCVFIDFSDWFYTLLKTLTHY